MGNEDWTLGKLGEEEARMSDHNETEILKTAFIVTYFVNHTDCGCT